MAHECTQREAISTLKSDVNNLKEWRNVHDVRFDRIENKIDKILWFFLGQTFTFAVSIIIGIVLYFINKN